MLASWKPSATARLTIVRFGPYRSVFLFDISIRVRANAGAVKLYDLSMSLYIWFITRHVQNSTEIAFRKHDDSTIYLSAVGPSRFIHNKMQLKMKITTYVRDIHSRENALGRLDFCSAQRTRFRRRHRFPARPTNTNMTTWAE